jgi:nicotinamide-nucleotide adenylyltransferase
MLEALLNDYPEVIIAIGSAQYSHTVENPFTASERFEMIRRTLEARELRRCIIVPVPDVGVHAQWVPHLRTLVPPFDVAVTNDPLSQRLFQEAGVKVDVRPLLNRSQFSGTEIRRRIVAEEDWEALVPREVVEVIKEIDGVGRIRELNGLPGGKDDEDQEDPKG